MDIEISWARDGVGDCTLSWECSVVYVGTDTLWVIYALTQRSGCRRATNRLANAQVWSRRWVFFFSPR